MAISIPNAVAQQEQLPYQTEILTKMVSFYDNGIDEKLYLQLDKPYYSAGDNIWFKGYLRNAITHAPLEISNFIYVELIAEQDELISRVKVKRDSTGFNGYITLDAEMEPGEYTLRGYTRWMRNKSEEYFFKRAISVISPIPEEQQQQAEEEESSRERRRREQQELLEESQREEQQSRALEFDLQFFPEGGALLEGILQRVAFKAIGSDGMSIGVEGSIYDSHDNLLGEFTTIYKGMGMVNIFAKAGESYYAKVTSERGGEQRFELPAVETQGAVISAVITDERLIYQVHSSDDSLLEGAHVIVSSHGRVVSAAEVQPQTLNIIASKRLFEGINIISLVDGAGKILSERLVFKPVEQSPTLEITTDKENYGRREKASVKIKLLDSEEQLTKGEFGVSITDNSSVKIDEAQDNILSNLLLTSDLEGYIEEPGLYFTDHNRVLSSRLDLLMRTQGWRRYDLEAILAQKSEIPQFNYENIVEVSGEVIGFFGNVARKPTIHVISVKMGVFDLFEIEQGNNFKLDLEIPDSAEYVIQARGRKGGTALTLNIEPESFPTPKSTFSPRAAEEQIPLSFVNQSQEKFFYDGGMDLIGIDAVYVTAPEKEESDYVVSPTRSTSREELENTPGLTLPLIIQRFPGISISVDGVVTYRGSDDPVSFIFNGMNVEYEEISFFNASELESVSFFDTFSGMFFQNSTGGVIAIEARKYSAAEQVKDMASVVNLSNLGYQKPTALYQPRYEVAEVLADKKPDFRTTLYWSAELEVDDTGEINFDFYTADKATSYTITLEGVTDDGEIYRASKSIDRSIDR